MAGTFWMAACLALASGVAWFAWSAHDFGHSCGVRLPGYPGGPTRTGEVLLIAVPGLLVATVRGLQTRTWLGAIGFGIVASVLAAASVAVAVLLWVASRHCGE